MTIRLLFRWPEEPSGSPGWDQTHDYRTASRGDLLWYFFPGDIILSANGGDIKTSFGWVPALHFALSMAYVCHALEREKEVIYAFTESGDEIAFRACRDLINIESTLSEDRLQCAYSELRSAVKAFLFHLFDDIQRKYPEFSEMEIAIEMRNAATSL